MRAPVPALACAILIAVGCRPTPTVASPGAAPPPTAERPPPAPAHEDPAADQPTASWDDPRQEREDYDAALQTAAELEATCRGDPEAVEVEALVQAYEVLAPYERAPDRDKAILALEGCRKAVSDWVRKNLPDVDEDERADFTAELEEAIRNANKRTTKNLSVTIEGSKVTIKKTGKAGAKKDEKTALQGYCAITSAPTITRITVVTDDHGEMSCSPNFEFSKQPGYVDRRVGIATPFEIQSTEAKRTPSPGRP